MKKQYTTPVMDIERLRSEEIMLLTVSVNPTNAGATFSYSDILDGMWTE